jgi:hypothetical protein
MGEQVKNAGARSNRAQSPEREASMTRRVYVEVSLGSRAVPVVRTG